MSHVVSNSSFAESLKAFLKPSVIRMLFFGFSAGIPILLIFSSLSLWLREAGVERSAVTFFSWAALGYSFKFIWAPLVDSLPLPILTKLMGRRRSWMLLSQLFVIVAILWMGFTNPTASDQSLLIMAAAAVLLGFSSATQDIVIDAYRIESDTAEMQALLSATYIAGYRIAMIVSGAGALHLADLFGSAMGNYSYSAWMWTYVLMASTMLVGVLTTLLSPEPDVGSAKESSFSAGDNARFLLLFVIVASTFAACFFFAPYLLDQYKEVLSPLLGQNLAGFFTQLIRFACALVLAGVGAVVLVRAQVAREDMLQETYIAPVKDFFERYGKSSAIILLSLVGLYRISDIVLGVISNVFYQDMGFTKPQIANIVKTFGLVMTIAGGFLGGLLTSRFGVIRILFLGALLSALTNLLFMALAYMGNSLPMLYVTISADNLAAGLASAAFVAFLSSLTNISFTAVQYAIFTSLMTLLPKLLGGYSGSMVDGMGYPYFFLFTTLIGVPVLLLVHVAGRRLN